MISRIKEITNSIGIGIIIFFSCMETDPKYARFEYEFCHHANNII